MLLLAAVTLVAVLAYFATTPQDPWSWRVLVAIVTVPFSLVCAGLLWRIPTRENAGASLLVIAFSLSRVGLPSDWRSATVAIVVISLAIAAPVVWAARTLPP